uniref:AAA+ ATPase domain-containing protein n=1 Tax=viral metagenome TaxID=1070528 RepID=A0A6C0KXS2_9ZZZZ
MSLNIHQKIIEKLDYFQKIHKIPNIIFHGPSGSGKRTIVGNFINKIYNNEKDKIKSFVMYVNCAHGKGIKFIREDLKFFAKTHINSNGGDVFKSIILLNADKLTTDAQSALRRCIELFSHNTRFFIIVEDKYKLLKPILSRFCEIYVSEPIISGKVTNLYKHNLNEVYKFKDLKVSRIEWLKKELLKIKDGISHSKIIEIPTKLYEKGYSGLDIIQLIENNNIFTDLSDDKRYELLFAFNKIKKELRNEKILIMFILNFLLLNRDSSLENISFM